MDIQKIDAGISQIGEALKWIEHVPAGEQLAFRKRLIDCRRQLKRLRFAGSEACSTAAFGESQMGKSYLVSAMLSTPEQPFTVTDGGKQYDFINEINPSRPNSTIEATGVITRFTTRTTAQDGWLRVRLLTIPDLLLILCEAFYNQLDYAPESVLSAQVIDESLAALRLTDPGSTVQCLITEDDLLDMREYIAGSSSLSKKCGPLLQSRFFDYLIEHLETLDEAQMRRTLCLLWNGQPQIGQLFEDMLQTYAALDYKGDVWVEFKSVLKRKGSLLDVARLDEMYGSPEDVGSDYDPNVFVRTAPDGPDCQLKKSFFSSLIAELSFCLPASVAHTHAFLNDLDILDFPGARRPEQIKESKLNEGKNLPTILRRGKVAYLFNKYSAAKRISTLLFCHNNSMTAESSMGALLDKWVEGNIGSSPREREDYVRMSQVPPLFIIGTWFNKDLEYHDEEPGDFDPLNARWNRRFNTILEKEVLKAEGSPEHWFHHWSTSQGEFQNIYMLRDFKYSRDIYGGYDPANHQPEQGEPLEPKFFAELKQSFIAHDFVKQHFANPAQSWDDAATCAHDGSLRIIERLNAIAPNVSAAREEKFQADVQHVLHAFSILLSGYYHPEDAAEQVRQAKRRAGTASLAFDRLVGRDPEGFARLMRNLMVSEGEIFMLVHSLLLGDEQEMPMSDEEARIFMSAGLDTGISREENVARLCDYLGAYDEEDCRNLLSGIDLDALLAPRGGMMSSRADNLVERVEQMWQENVLTARGTNAFEQDLPMMGTIVSALSTLYRLVGLHDKLVDRVQTYINDIDREHCVGVISDYLSVELNRFTTSFGFAFYSDKERAALLAKNHALHLNLDEALLFQDEKERGIDLLGDLYRQKELLAGKSFGSNDRQFLSRFPEHRSLWRWQQEMRAGFIYALELPNYDVKANAELKKIIDSIPN